MCASVCVRAQLSRLLAPLSRHAQRPMDGGGEVNLPLLTDGSQRRCSTAAALQGTARSSQANFDT